MKNLLALIVLLIILTGCQDKYTESYMANVPVYMSLEDWRAQEINLKAPRQLNEPGKIYIYENFLFTVDQGTGVHLFNNADPSSPQNIGFIELLGAADVAVRNDILYIDSYMDLVSFDISDPANPAFLCRAEDVFNATPSVHLSRYDPSLPIAY